MNRKILTLGGLAALTVGLASADRAEVHIEGGHLVEAEMLREADDALYLDLGFDVLRVPREAITALTVGEQSTGEDFTAPEVTGSTDISDFRQDLDRIRQAIVLVSTPSGFGAGFVVDPSGLIISNHHVVREDKFVRVTFYDADGEGTTPIDDVELIAFSRLHDISLLQIPEDKMPEEPLVALPLDSDDGQEVGDVCFAIGNPGMGRQILSQSVGEGIISSLQRNFYGILYIQTTAPVNPGNSGGPLIGSDGAVIGLITYKAWLENVGFALPVREIRRFLNNRAAYLADDLNPNTGHRYLVPGEAIDESSE